MKDESQFENKYPAKNFTKKVFDFSVEEVRKLTSLDTIAQMGQMAQMMVNQFVQGECLARVGVISSKDTGILYDIPNGKFTVFVPKKK